MKRFSILLALGCGASVAGPPPEVPARNEEVVATVSDVALPEATEEPAEGVQLAGGRLGSVMPGLTPGTWADLEGEYGSPEGIGAPSDHVVERTTPHGTYTLHIVAWESFRQIPEGTSLEDFALALGGQDARVIAAPNDELGIAARIVLARRPRPSSSPVVRSLLRAPCWRSIDEPSSSAA
ncbi:MAG: hypothetical protein ACI9KE_003852 [Polyangiales bacterium]|jgi:hypothetical protein